MKSGIRVDEWASCMVDVSFMASEERHRISRIDGCKKILLANMT